MGIVIGVYGLYGSGKTTVSHFMEKNYGFYRIEADKVGHECLEEPECRQKLIESFGDGILQNNGSISRERISAIVFKNTRLKKQLECILWPMMTEKIIRQIQSKNNVVLDAAVLFSAKWNTLCDYAVYVEIPEILRARNLSHRSISKEQIQEILASQIDMEQQKKLADYQIRNNGSIEALSYSVNKIMTEIRNREAVIFAESGNKKVTK